MPRIRAVDYEDKKIRILDAAADLFADQGYAGARMDEIAKACGVSKSMLYHYFEKKEDVLFEILQEHLFNLGLGIKDHILNGSELEISEYFQGFIAVYLQPTRESRARHVVAMHDMRYLTNKQKVEQVKLEREILTLVQTVLEHIKPGCPAAEYRVSAFLLVGMLNWVELWYKSSGPISPTELYQKMTTPFLKGFIDGGQTKSAIDRTAGPRRSNSSQDEAKGWRHGVCVRLTAA